MIEVRFHQAVYSEAAVDKALEVFSGFATFDRSQDGDEWVIRVESPSAAKADLIAAELGNYALGLTIGSRGRQT